MGTGILSAIGKTPLIQLDRYLDRREVELFAKLEFLNPGGSIKDRPALAILEDAIRSGQVGPGSVIVESSPGNMGVGLAQVCMYFGFRFVCVVDPKITPQNVQMLRAYGAELHPVSEPDPATGEWLQARLARVEALLQEIPRSFWPNQYCNPLNPRAHFEATVREIADALDGRIDALFVATSTCGTIRGCAEFVRQHGIAARIVAVDAKGSLIFSAEKARRMIPGLGAGLRPPLCDVSLIDDVIHVTDLECVAGCRKLVRREAILAGGSSGAVMAAVEKLHHAFPDQARLVVILPDRGERYLETVYDDAWVRENCEPEEPLINVEDREKECQPIACSC